MVRLLMFRTPIGDSFLYTYGEDSPINDGVTVKRYTKGSKRIFD